MTTMTTERKRILEIVVIVAVILACALALATLGGCCSPAKPANGSAFDDVQKFIGPRYVRQIEGDEVRWFVKGSSNPRWLYYAKFDAPVLQPITLRINLKTGEMEAESAEEPAKLVEWAENLHALREAGPR